MSSIPHRLKNTINSINNIVRSLLVTEKDSRQIYWILVVITLCGLILRALVMNRPIGYDEAYTFIYFASRPFKYILADYHAPNNHILNSILIGIAYRILGSHIWIVRVPAFIASVLSIPAAYFMARRFYTANQALAASAVLAIYPSLIQSTANGRGYMLVILFSFMLANFAGILVYKQERPALIAFAITGALGFYAVPIFLYPMAGVSLWVAATYLLSSEPGRTKLNRLAVFLVTCVACGLLTLVLYSPVILFGTGLNSIINNEIVTSQSWSYFFESLSPRITRTWADWTVALSPAIKYLLSSGFLLSVIFHRKASSQKLPLQLCLFLAIAILLVLQRVAPLPRIWIYLEIFCVIFSVAGLTWFVTVLLQKTMGQINSNALLPPIILLFTITIFVNSVRIMQDPAAVAERGKMPEQYAADYLTDHIKPGDTILSIAPVDIRTAYYLKINGVPYDVFYQRDHPVEFQNALVIFRHREERNTPDKVVDFFQLLPKLDMASAELVYEYGELQIYSIPVNK